LAAAATVAGPVLGWFLTCVAQTSGERGIKAAEEGSVLFEAPLEPIQDTEDAEGAHPSEVEIPEQNGYRQQVPCGGSGHPAAGGAHLPG